MYAATRNTTSSNAIHASPNDNWRRLEYSAGAIMPNYLITAPDGKKFQVTAPEGATQQQVLSYAQAHWGSLGGATSTTPKPSAPNPINPSDAAIGAGVVSGLGSAALGTAQLAGK